MVEISKKTNISLDKYYENSKYDIFNVIAPFRGELKKIFLFSFLINILTVMLPLYLMFIIDGKINLSFDNDGFLNIVFLVALIFFNFLFRYTRTTVVNFILRSADANICNRILEKVFKIPAKKMEKKNDAFWHSVFADIDVIRNGLSSVYIVNIFDIPFILLFMGITGILFGKYFFIVLFTFVFYSVIVGFALYMLGIVDDKEKLAIKERDELVSNTIRDLSSLKTLSLSDKIMYMWKDYQRSIIDNTYKRNYTLDIFLVLSTVLYFISITIFTFIGCLSYDAGIMSLGAIIATLLLLGQSFFTIDNFIKYLPQYFKFLNSSERLTQVMEEQGEALKTETIEDVTLGNIILKQFTLMDSRKNTILKDVDFTFSDGSLYIVRAKNTFDGSLFLRTLFGGYEGENGEVLFDRYNIQTIKTDSLKNFIHYTNSTSFVIEGTIKENLNCLLSKNSADTSFSGFMDYKKASSLLGFDEIVSKLPNGYNTIIDAKTELLSAEELKLLSIVRAFVGNPKVILLDQPFVGLRRNYRDNLIRVLQSMKQDKIILISTQYQGLSDCIFVNIEDGNIVTTNVEAGDFVSQSSEQDTDPSETHALFKRIFKKK